MINDPEFVRLHLNRFNNQPRYESRFLFTEKSRKCVEISFVGTTNSVGLPHSLGSLGTTPRAHTLEGGVRSWFVLCSTDGLFMLKSVARFGSTHLMLWNPSIRKTLILPLIPRPWMCHLDLGIGFNPLIKDYKYVSLSVSGENVSCIAVYTLGIKSWKTITNSLPEHSTSCWRTKAVSFRGGLFYLTRKDYSSPLKLVTFNFSTEMVASTHGLFEVNGLAKCVWLQELTVIDSGCTLALFNYSYSNSKGSIWALESLGADIKSSILTQRYAFTISISEVKGLQIEFLSLEKNGEMLLRWRPHMVTSYNLETHEEKILLRKELNDSHPYIESLILL